MRGLGRIGVATLAAGLAGRYLAGRHALDRSAARGLDVALADLGEVGRVSILPLVERHTADPGLGRS